MNRIVIIDGYSLFFRAFYATAYTGQFMQTSTGLPTNALFSFSNMLFKILNEHNFTHILVALDPGGKTFRHELMPEYKGTRSKTPDELIPQFELIPELLQSLNITGYSQSGFEADDIIGTIAKEAEEQGFFVDILSSDRDLLQLIDNNTTVRLLKKGLSEIEDMTLEGLYDELQLTPEQIPELKGLMGDKSDNIPGIPGVGPKTALKLLHQYTTIDGIYEHLEDLKDKQKSKFIEFEEQARLSRELATINCQMDVDLDLDKLQYSSLDLHAAEQFFHKIEAKSLVKKAQTTYNMQQVTAVAMVDSFMDGLLADVESNSQVSLTLPEDIGDFAEETVLYFEHPYENYHDHPEALYVGILTNNQTYVLTWADFQSSSQILTWLAASDKKKIVYDSKKTYALCCYAGIEIKGISFDIKLGSYVINSINKVEELADVAQIFGYSLPYMETIYGKNTKFSIADTKKIISYTKEATLMCELCAKQLALELAEEQLLTLLLDVEMPLAKILADMELTGIRVDEATLLAQGNVISERVALLEKEIYELAGETFNIASPKQLGIILFEKLHLPVIKKTKTGYSTAADVLDALMNNHEIIPLIGVYRQLTKLNSTYIKGLVPLIANDGKIHTIYKQSLTQTGRLSSIEPNLQNIPIRLEEGRLIRKAFVPHDADHILLSADYSQIELRVLAELAQVEELIDAFVNERDIHRETAMKIFDVTYENVTPLMRTQAKTVNFGIIYGMSDFGLATQLQIGRKSAKLFIEKYFELFPGIKTYMADTIAEAEKNGYVETLLKRRRYFPTIRSTNFNERNFAKRAAMNAPIQGTAADILKLAMIHISERINLEKLASKMILQVHDELIFDAKKTEVEKLKIIVIEEMTQAFIEMQVPLAVDVAVGETWYESK